MAFSGIESGIAKAPPTHFKWYVRNGRNGPKRLLVDGGDRPEAAISSHSNVFYETGAINLI
jgi:hypothetical protein